MGSWGRWRYLALKTYFHSCICGVLGETGMPIFGTESCGYMVTSEHWVFLGRGRGSKRISEHCEVLALQRTGLLTSLWRPWGFERPMLGGKRYHRGGTGY